MEEMRRGNSLEGKGESDDGEESEESSGGGNAFLKLPYGLAKGKGLSTDGMRPREVWDMLKGEGVSKEAEDKKLEKKLDAPQPVIKNAAEPTTATQDKKPSVTPTQIAAAKQKLKTNGYPESGFMSFVDNADKNGYATYDLKTGKPVDIKDGYFVSFQVNKTMGVHRDYTADEYDNYVYECITRTGSMPYLGTYGNPEISFNAKDKKVALQMMRDYNQASIYDVVADDIITNDDYNKKTNPTED